MNAPALFFLIGGRDTSGPPVLRRLSQAFSEIRSPNSRANFDLVEKPEFTLTETLFRTQIAQAMDGDTDGLRIHRSDCYL